MKCGHRFSQWVRKGLFASCLPRKPAPYPTAGLRRHCEATGALRSGMETLRLCFSFLSCQREGLDSPMALTFGHRLKTLNDVHLDLSAHIPKATGLFREAVEFCPGDPHSFRLYSLRLGWENLTARNMMPHFEPNDGEEELNRSVVAFH